MDEDLHALVHPASPRSPVRVLLLSAGASPDEVAEGLAAGADAYLPKPFGIEHLVSQVRALTAELPS